ncbi:MAG: regulatory protein RecX [Nitrospirota bacterium]
MENEDKGYNKLLQYGLRLFTKKRYTTGEMQKKLTTYAKKREAIDERKVERVVERLKELGYLDDEQFVKDYVSHCARVRPRGRILIARELKFKGLPKDLIEEGLEKVDIDEEAMAFDILERRVKRWSRYSEYEQKPKAYQFLYSKGFNRDAIYKAIERCYNHG